MFYFAFYFVQVVDNSKPKFEETSIITKYLTKMTLVSFSFFHHKTNKDLIIISLCMCACTYVFFVNWSYWKSIFGSIFPHCLHKCILKLKKSLLQYSMIFVIIIIITTITTTMVNWESKLLFFDLTWHLRYSYEKKINAFVVYSLFSVDFNHK